MNAQVEPSLYTPSPWQSRFHALQVDEALGAGAAGPGKTLTLVMDPLEQIVVEHTRCTKRFDHTNDVMVKWANEAGLRRGVTDPVPPFSKAELEQFWREDCYHEAGASVGWALHLRRLSKMLDQTVERFKRIYGRIDPQMHWNEQKLTATFSSGYHMQFGHCKDRDDYAQYYSSEFTAIYFDELVQFLESQYDQITSRLRASDWIMRRMLRIRSMSNPMVKREANEDFVVENPYWVRDLFVEPAPEGNTILKKKIRMQDGEIRWKTRIYLPAKLSDNPDAEFRKDYEQRLRGMKAHMRAALLEGDWYFSADGFFAEDWNPNIHVCEPFAIPDDWQIFRSMDWGYKKPGTIGWGALDPEGTLFVFREYTFKGKTATEVAKRALELEDDEGLLKNGRSTISGPADTQLWEERGSQAMSMAEEFALQGMNWVPADKKSRRRNAQLLLGRLKDHDDGRSAPGIVFFRTCKNCLRTIPSIPTDPGDTECPMDGGDDHWLDMVLYLCAYVSRRDKWARRETDDDDFKDDPEQPGNGGYDGYGGVA